MQEALETPVGDLLKSKGSLNASGHRSPEAPVCLDSSLTIQEGCEALAAHKILSAPVYDESEGGFIGMLDFRDMISLLLEVVHHKKSIEGEMVLSLASLKMCSLYKENNRFCTRGDQRKGRYPGQIRVQLVQTESLDRRPNRLKDHRRYQRVS
jgi:hypothetical protein